MSEQYRAVIDRIVDGTTAVLLLESDGETVDERTVDVETLPAKARHEGAVCSVTVTEDSIRELEYLPAAESERRESAQDRFDQLSKRLGDE